MTRMEFIRVCSLLGISPPLQPTLMGATHTAYQSSFRKFKGNVLIIGAGAAGLTAAYRLSQLGINFQVLEASSHYGGRMKIRMDFVDFPISLGAEWLHVKRNVFDEIVNSPGTDVAIKTRHYESDDYGLYDGEERSLRALGFGDDQKFIGSSWFHFFEHYVMPSIQDKIRYHQVVNYINYADDSVVIKTSTDRFEADKVIVTVPVKMLQKASVEFTPQLPKYKRKAINNVTVWDGFKAFIEFSEKFYPTVIESKVFPKKSGQKMYYDASYGQDSKRHVLGLFTVGSATLPYRQLSDNELIEYMLKELDAQFDGKASSRYLKHISQNWNKEPFIKGAYVYDKESWKILRTLGESVDNKVFFAGTAYTTGNDWGSVHSAAHAAIRAVNEIVQPN